MLGIIGCFITRIFRHSLKKKKNEGICTPSSIAEAAGAVGCIEQGLIKNLTRISHAKRGAFIDDDGICWDIKTIRTYSMFGQPIFNTRNIEFTLQNELVKVRKNLVLNITNLFKNDRDELYKILKFFEKDQLQRIIILHKEHPEQSKSPQDLIKFLELE